MLKTLDGFAISTNETVIPERHKENVLSGNHCLSYIIYFFLNWREVRGLLLKYQELLLTSKKISISQESKVNRDESSDEEDELPSKPRKFSQADAYEEFLQNYSSDYPHISNLIRLMLVQPANAACCERNFSKMKTIKTKKGTTFSMKLCITVFVLLKMDLQQPRWILQL